MKPSISEDHGIATLTDKDIKIYSVGISTAGLAERRMAELNAKRHIIATTIDVEGAKLLQEKNHSKQITIKVEDVRQPLPYQSETFDFIYARLILHYLSKKELIKALEELYRILKVNGTFFIVVRSTECEEAKSGVLDPITGLTTYSSYQRYFHSKKSIQEFLIDSGFTVKKINTYKEQIYIDFMRTKPSSYVDILIEVIASK